MQKLFVYGTLCPGRPNEHILKNIGGKWEVGKIKGTLHEKGWGATMGYPAVKLSENGDFIEGYVFSSDQLENHWQTLDEFEGEAYERVLTKVLLNNDIIIEAYVYALKL